MIDWQFIFALFSGIILFLYGIEQFSGEIQHVAGKRFRNTLQRYTRTRIHGTVLGALVTALIQSSTATTVITVGLVNAGTLSFIGSLGIIFGANIGTTITAQLVAFKLTSFAPVFIVIGFLISIAGGRWRAFGKPVFYFGLVFFSLNLVSAILAPYQNDPMLVGIVASLDNVFLEILAGFLITTIFQSSSVAVGLIVIMAMNGLITPAEGIPIVLGANLGTPTTALLVASRMNTAAKRTAVAQFLFNLIGVLIFIPVMGPFSTLITDLGGSPAQQIANAHFIFNVICAIIFLVLLGPFATLVQKLVPGEYGEIVFLPVHLTKPLPPDKNLSFGLIQEEVAHLIQKNVRMMKLVFVIEKTATREKSEIKHLHEYIHYLTGEIDEAIVTVSKADLTQGDAGKIAVLIRISDLSHQLADQIWYLCVKIHKSREKPGLISEEFGNGFTTITNPVLENLTMLSESFPSLPKTIDDTMRINDSLLRDRVNHQYGIHIRKMADSDDESGTVMYGILSGIEQISVTIREIRKTVLLIKEW